MALSVAFELLESNPRARLAASTSPANRPIVVIVLSSFQRDGPLSRFRIVFYVELARRHEAVESLFDLLGLHALESSAVDRQKLRVGRPWRGLVSHSESNQMLARRRL
jgi:hypothetical protein